ncbi:hypothetical protein JCM11491_000607 [Sporobolomyces phaffii]
MATRSHDAAVDSSPTTALASRLGGLSLRDPVPVPVPVAATVPRRAPLTPTDSTNRPRPWTFDRDSTEEQTLKPSRDDDDDLAALAVSSTITELSMSIQDVSTLIFEIQELRHTTTTTATSDDADKHGLSAMDHALIKLDARLDEVGAELNDVRRRVEPLLPEAAGLLFLRDKWHSTLAEWDQVERDAEMLGHEMNEDKWLVVFNSVTKQAEVMMRSLDKVLSQSHAFVHDVDRRRRRGRDDSGDIQPLLSSFVALHRSLHAKVKYYSPACDRVLAILGQGIADRSTKNGQVLRRFADMKLRWRELHDRIAQVEAEMGRVETWLERAAGPPQVDHDDHRDDASPVGGKIATVSPLRRLANKMSPNSNSTPTRPDRFFRRASSSSSPSSHPNLPRPAAPGPPPPPLPLPLPQTPLRRATSPMPMPTPGSALANRPRWNPSTKRTDEEREVLSQSHLGHGRPAARPSGARPSSRLSMTSSLSRSYSGAPRPISPAFSDASSSAGAIARDRPATPSRIPRPASVIRPRSTTPYDGHAAANTSILQRIASSPPPTTRTSRPPPSSNRYSLSRSTGSPPPRPPTIPRSSSASLLAVPSPDRLGPSSARAASPSLTSSNHHHHHLRGGQTPEPSLIAHAHRLARVVRAPASSSTTTLRPRPSRPLSPAAAFAPGGGTTGAAATATAVSYVANAADPLDRAVAAVVNALPLALHVERVVQNESTAVFAEQLVQARYVLSLAPPPPPTTTTTSRGGVLLKLVDRVGRRTPRGIRGDATTKKVVARVGGGWQDLESHCLSLIARAL